MSSINKSIKERYIGLMSGTSLEAIDAVLVEFNPVKLITTHSETIPAKLKQQLLALCTPGDNAIMRMGKADVALGQLFAQSCLNLLAKTNITPQSVRAIGSHGQTIRHMPDENYPFTLQIGDPNIIAALTDITTVADFRRRDLALGGQAAPLAPAFHNFLLRDKNENRWILNIGGIANVTFLARDLQQPIIGFDTGPGNTLLDAWTMHHLNQPYDRDGEWAASGHVQEKLLQSLLADPYFQSPAPKSTGREYFNLSWLTAKLNHHIKPADVQATLLELTAKSIAQAIHNFSSKKEGSIWLCGGGTHNQQLIKRINALCQPLRVTDTTEIVIHPDWIEAVCFAWLAKQTLAGNPGNLPSVTGAQRPTILGAVYRTT